MADRGIWVDFGYRLTRLSGGPNVPLIRTHIKLSDVISATSVVARHRQPPPPTYRTLTVHPLYFPGLPNLLAWRSAPRYRAGTHRRQHRVASSDKTIFTYES